MNPYSGWVWETPAGERVRLICSAYFRWHVSIERHQRREWLKKNGRPRYWKRADNAIAFIYGELGAKKIEGATRR